MLVMLKVTPGNPIWIAEANGVTKIALGHHRDDILRLFSEFIFQVKNENDAAQVSLR